MLGSKIVGRVSAMGVALALGVGSIAGVASAQSIGINIVGGRNANDIDAILAPDDVAGIIAQANWNNIADFNSATGSFSGMVDNSGVDTGVSVETDTNNTWSIATGAPADANSKLMKGYLDTTDSSTSSVDISDIPYDLYEVWAYFDGGDSSGSRSGIYVADDGTQQDTFTGLTDGANWPVVAGGGVFTTVNGDNQTGNAVLLGVFTGTDLSVTATPTNPAAFRAPLNAVQIVKVDPTVISGDFNGDQVVDVADFDILAMNFGVGTDLSQGNLDRSGVVSLSDALAFRTLFIAAGGDPGLLVLPEPGSMVLASVGGLMLLRRRRR